MKLYQKEYFNDKTMFYSVGDTRKEKLTLKYLNKLRKEKEIREFEDSYNSEMLELIYGSPENQQSNF